MQETYNISDLIIGELVTISNLGGSYGTIETTEGPFIFNKKGEKYSEIFTEEEYGLGPKPSIATGGRNYKVSNNVETNTFGKTYIKKTDEVRNYLTEEELLTLQDALKDVEILNQQIQKINEDRKKNGESKFLKLETPKFVLSKKRLLEVYNQIKEKQTIENLRRENEERALERQFLKTRPIKK